MGFLEDMGEGLRKGAEVVAPGVMSGVNYVAGAAGEDRDDFWTGVDKKFISGDWDKERAREKKRKAEVERAQREQERNIDRQSERGEDFFSQEGNRNQRRDLTGEQYQQRFGENVDQNFRNVRRNELQYQEDLGEAEDVSRENMERADKAYKNLSPMYREAMDSAETEADSAMSLRDYMNPDNQVMQDTRQLYNQEGEGLQQRYDQQARNIGKQGQANYGILSSLGSQAAAQAMGSQGPMTVGQQMAQMATANQQAGEAYANTQRRMQQLRDIGMQGRENLRQQGIERGFDRSDRSYAAGQDAKNRLSRSMQNYENFEDRGMGRRRQISDRMRGLGQERLGSRGRVEDTRFSGIGSKNQLGYDMTMQELARGTNLDQSRMNYENAIDALRSGRTDIDLDTELAELGMQSARDDARMRQRQGLLKSGLKTAGTVAGAAFGGPAGAQAGNAAGNAIGGGLQSARPPRSQGVMNQMSSPANYPSRPGMGYNPGSSNALTANYPVRDAQRYAPSGLRNMVPQMQ